MGVQAVVAQAFDRAAGAYDSGFGANPSGLLFRQVFQRRLLERVPPGGRALDLGCGTGEDAVLLAELGRRVHAIDLSPGMVQRCREKAVARGLQPGRLTVEVRAAEDVGLLEGPFDAAYSDFGALNCADLHAVGRGLAAVLRPGAAVVLSVMPPRPLPGTVLRLFTGRGEPRGRSSPLVGGIPVPIHHPSANAVRAAFGREFAWERCAALGALLPGPGHGLWPGRHPLAFGLLAALEGLVREWPLVRGLGDHLLLEGVRR